MDLQSVLSELRTERNPQAVRQLFKEARGKAGFAKEYFGLVQGAFGSHPSLARALSSHWRLALDYGDDAALAYRIKGVYDRLEGRWLDSAKAFVKAGSLAGSHAEQLSFQVGAIDGYAHAGRVQEAVTLGKKLARGLDRLGENGLSGRVRLNLGHALLWVDRYVEARKWLSEAVTALEEGGFRAEAISARLSLSTAELYGGSPIRAQELAEEARAAAASESMDYAVRLCELNIAQATLLQGRADEALQVLLVTRPALVESPHDHARVSEFLGDAYLRLNLWAEAVDAYDDAIARRRSLPVLNIAASHLGRGQALFADGRSDLALSPLKKAARQFASAGNVAWAAAAESSIAKVLFDRGQIKKAAATAATAAQEARQAKSPWHEAEALLTKLGCGPGAGSSSDLQRAASLIARNGYISMAWRVPAIKADWAQVNQKLGAYRRSFESIVSSRILTSSAASRTAFLRDKSEHISRYLTFLLATPTPARVREAIDVIARSRSAALIDEILTSASQSLRPSQLLELEQLRAELQSLEAEGNSPGGFRRSSGSVERASALQRRWIEATHRLVVARESKLAGRSDAVVLTQARDGYFALRQSKATRLNLSTSELQSRLKWIRFELLGPMADRNAEHDLACSLIRDLACRLAPALDVKGRGTISICPDGQLWQVPWTTCVSALDSGCEVVLALHPTLTRISQARVNRNSKIMVWVDNSENLYHAEGEAASFLKRFPNARICRSASEVRDSLSEQVELLHVIGHARHNASNPMFSAMQFADGPVYATEIARSNLRADLVTLSACDTGNVSLTIRDEPDGLARSFLARGAHTVIGSLWPLDDEAAARLYGSFFAALVQGASPAESLNRARLETREWQPHPYFWGSLALFGGYGI